MARQNRHLAAPCVVLLCCTCIVGAAAAATTTSKPNIVLVLVDDQGTTMNETHPRFMPSLNKHIITKGVFMPNYAVNTPVCCPSRGTLLTGRYAHNTNFTDLFPPHGGYSYWREADLDKYGTLPQWMAQQGYSNYYTGKLLVEYAFYNCDKPPAGYTDIDALTLPYVFEYYSPAFSRNGAPPVQYKGQYTVDVVADKALAQLKTAAAEAKRPGGRPFFMQVAPIAPHDQMSFAVDKRASTQPPIPAVRHAKLYEDVTLPQTSLNFNASSTGAAWLRALPPLTLANVTYMNNYYRQRLRALRSVDEMVDRLVNELEAQGLLENTYFIYTGDNGYHIGMYRQGAGKEEPYEEDIKVPFYIRGPGLKQGVTNPGFGTHVDLASTLVTLAGGSAPAMSDGQPLPLQQSAEPGAKFAQPKQEYDNTALEFWGEQLDQITHVRQDNYAWKGVRGDFAAGKLFKYIVWCSGEHELYDLTHDPYALDNLLAPGATSLFHSSSDVARYASRLDALLSAWYNCAGPEQCVAPLKRVLPEAKTLADTLDPKYDAFFAGLSMFGFKTCLGYFRPDNEFGPFDAQLKPAQPPTPLVDWSKSRLFTEIPPELLKQMTDALMGAVGGGDVNKTLGLDILHKKISNRKMLSQESVALRFPPVVSVNTGAGLVTHVAPVEAFAVPLPLPVLTRQAEQLIEAIKYKRWTVADLR